MSLNSKMTLATVLVASVSCLPVEFAAAQVAPVRRQTGGWQASAAAVAPIEVQTAYFQAQGSFSDGPPVLPSAAGLANSGGLPSFNAGNAMVQPPAYPAQNASAYDNLSAPQLPMRNPGNEINAQLPSYQSATAANSPANYAAPPVSYPTQPVNNYGPSNNYSERGVPAQLTTGELRTIQNERLQTQRQDAPQNQAPANRTGSASPTQLPSPRAAAQDIAYGLPFVTPPPRGRYATSPYQPAVFQNAAYQPLAIPAQLASTTTAAPPAQLAAQQQYVAPPAGGPPQYLTQQQAALPQYRYPQPGVYPTSYQCTTPSPSFPSTGAVPGAYVPPTLPPNLTPGLYTPNNSGYTPFFSLGQENYNVQLGRGIVGQPTVYVPGQPIRNFMRYLSP